MLKIYFLLAVLFTTLTGCGVTVSESGTEAVLQEYGGTLIAKAGVNTSTDNAVAQGRYAELELTNDKLEAAFPKLSIPASNCAHLFYQAVSPAERTKYHYIRVIIRGKNNSYSQFYSTKELDAVEMARYKFGGSPNSGDEENSTKLKLLQKCLQLLAVAVNSEATFAA